jgi:hypothetical protein
VGQRRKRAGGKKGGGSGGRGCLDFLSSLIPRRQRKIMLWGTSSVCLEVIVKLVIKMDDPDGVEKSS